MRSLPLLATILSFSTLLFGATAEADLNIAPGLTSVDNTTLRITYDVEYDLTQWHPQMALRLASGLLLLDGDDETDNVAWVVTPAFRYNLLDNRSFVEVGIGGGIFLETRVESQDLSTAFQFENRLAAGYRLGQKSELGVSAIHYSNARLDSPNDGFEVYALTYRYAF